MGGMGERHTERLSAMKNNKPATKKRLVGYGYVGAWSDGTLGWVMS